MPQILPTHHSTLSVHVSQMYQSSSLAENRVREGAALCPTHYHRSSTSLDPWFKTNNTPSLTTLISFSLLYSMISGLDGSDRAFASAAAASDEVEFVDVVSFQNGVG